MHTFKSAFALLFILVTPFSVCAAEEWTGLCIRVVDGDTIHVSRNGGTEIIRLYAIDCPEKGEPGFADAGKFTETYLLDREVRVVRIRKGAYNRIDGVVFVDNMNFNQILLEQGWAKVWPKYCRHRDRDELARHEAIAREKGLGIWAKDMPPSRPEPYRANPRTGKFHLAECRHSLRLRDGIPFATREEAVQQLFHPCGSCTP